MRRLVPALVALGLTLSAGSAFAAGRPPKEIVDSVTKVLTASASDNLVEPGQTPTAAMTTPPAAMFSQVDINGDGKPDWKVDYDRAPNASLFCGTGGCTVELWASQPGGGYAKVMEELVREVNVSHRNGVTRLDLDFHGTVCGGAGVDPCERGYVWDEDAGWVAVANKDGKTWLYAGPVDLNLYNRGDRPAAVERAFEQRQALCPPGGGKTERDTWSATRIPDVNGDGQGDWVIGGAYDTCVVNGDEDRPPLPVAVLVSGPGDAWTEAYASSGIAWAIDIGAGPATFYVLASEQECRDGEGRLTSPCGKPLRWDAASGKLVE